jgi:hypothetical protein
MDDGSLMEKYRLSAKGLQRIFEKLVAGGFLTRLELDARVNFNDDTADIEDLRDFPRNYPVLSVSVFEGNRKGAKGTVRDITEKGVGIVGIEARVHEQKTFFIDAGRLSEFDTIRFDAECRWIKWDCAERRYVAGFEITKISKDALEELREMIGGFTLTADTFSMMLP